MPMSTATSTKAEVVVKPLKPKPKPTPSGGKEVKEKKKGKKGELKPPKAAAFFLKGVRLDVNSASSDSENQLEEDKPVTLGSDILCKLKKYDAHWFRDIALHHPQYFVDTQQYVHGGDSQLLFPPKFQPIAGFRSARFCGASAVVSYVGRFVCFLDLAARHRFWTKEDQQATVGALTVSPDYQYLVVCIDHAEGAKLIVRETEKCAEIKRMPCSTLASSIKISHGNELILTFTIEEMLVRLAVYSFEHEKMTGEGVVEIRKNDQTQNWQISFCPADEGLVCLVDESQARLLRNSNGTLEIFTSIQLTGETITCHEWFGDITLAFGTVTGNVKLFHEKTQLNVIDLTELQNDLFRGYNNLSVSSLCSGHQIFLCSTDVGAIFMWTINNGHTDWSVCRVFIVPIIPGALDRRLKEILLNADESELLCIENNSIFHVPFGKLSTELVKINGFDLLAADHSSKIISLSFAISSNQERIVSLDSDGIIIVHNLNTGNALSWRQVADAQSVAFHPNGHQVFVQDGSGIKLHQVAFRDLSFVNSIYEGTIQHMELSQSGCKLLIVESSTLMSLLSNTGALVWKQFLGSNINIAAMSRSGCGNYIALLSDKETVTMHDARSGKALWSINFKLRDFIDITLATDVIFLLNKKFVLSLVKSGKELDQVNVHNETIGFDNAPMNCVANENYLLIGTTNGKLMIVYEVTEKIVRTEVVETNIESAVTKQIEAAGGRLSAVGFEDGSILIMDRRAPADGIASSADDAVQCSADELSALQRLVQELETEKNNVRKNAAEVMREFKGMKSKELDDAKEAFEQKQKALHLRIAKLEETLDADGLTHNSTISSLRALYNEESELQRRNYESMMEQHMRKAIAEEESFSESLKLQQEQFDRELDAVRGSFAETENSWQVHCEQLENVISTLKAQLTEEREDKSNYEQNVTNKLTTAVKSYEQRALSHRQEASELATELISLKATSIVLGEERDEALDIINSQKMEIQMLKEDCEKLSQSVDTKEKAALNIGTKIENLQKELLTSKKNHQEVTKRLHRLEKELDAEKLAGKLKEREKNDLLRHFKQVRDGISDPKRLRQAVLDMCKWMNENNLGQL
uniref:Pyrrolo-quinoline quinone repeat domain-containing protein n=2 Tax=Plectus sambesii TaxID=2011161 RepID=A0A914VEG7_9BILA